MKKNYLGNKEESPFSGRKRGKKGATPNLQKKQIRLQKEAEAMLHFGVTPGTVVAFQKQINRNITSFHAFLLVLARLKIDVFDVAFNTPNFSSKTEAIKQNVKNYYIHVSVIKDLFKQAIDLRLLRHSEPGSASFEEATKKKLSNCWNSMIKRMVKGKEIHENMAFNDFEIPFYLQILKRMGFESRENLFKKNPTFHSDRLNRWYNGYQEKKINFGKRFLEGESLYHLFLLSKTMRILHEDHSLFDTEKGAILMQIEKSLDNKLYFEMEKEVLAGKCKIYLGKKAVFNAESIELILSENGNLKQVGYSELKKFIQPSTTEEEEEVSAQNPPFVCIRLRGKSETRDFADILGMSEVSILASGMEHGLNLKVEERAVGHTDGNIDLQLNAHCLATFGRSDYGDLLLSFKGSDIFKKREALKEQMLKRKNNTEW